MSTLDNPMRRKIKEAARELNISSSRTSFASNVKALTEKVLTGWNAVTVPQTRGAFGLESLGEVVPTRNEAFDVNRDGDVVTLMRGLKDLGMAPRHIESTTEACLSLFDKASYNTTTILQNGQQSEAYAPLSSIVGRTSAAMISKANEFVGTEAFGDDINRLAVDDRLTMDLMIMRPFDNIMDKGLARVNEASPVVTVKVPAPEAWDWGKTQDSSYTAADDASGSNTYPLRDLYRNPTPVNSSPKKIVALAANDSTGVLWNSTTAYYSTGKDVSLKDLSRDATKFMYAHVDRTDLISDGGRLDAIIVGVTNGTDTEYFKIDTSVFDLANYVMSTSTKSSGQRQVMMTATLPISATTKQYDGTASTFAAALTDAKIAVNIRINSTLDIKTGMLQASGSASMELLQLANGTPISGATNTLFGTLTATVDAYSVDLYFDEENQRKANLAIWTQYYQLQFLVPRGRVYFTEYSLTQDVDENAVATTSSIVALGNGRRGLDIIVNGLNDISRGLSFAESNPEVAAANTIAEQSFAASLVKPTVVTSSIDYDTTVINDMNESTRLTEIHGHFRARFLSMVTMLYAKSLMLNQYKGGERPVIKAWVHSTIADVVIGILDYHPELNDQAAIASGADYSMLLPNGYRLDIIKSNMDCLQQRIYAVPVIESDMTSILSAATIRDCGTVSTNYTPTNNASVTRRFATTTREIVFFHNRVGMCLEVKGLSTQLGTFGYDAIELNNDYSDSIAL